MTKRVCYHVCMQLLVLFLLSALLTLAIVHAAALHFFLYWKYNWFDIPMHFLGGLCVALGFAILPYFRVTLPERYTTFLAYVAVVLIVGLSWEVFEIASGVNVIDEYFVGDTILDIIMDLFGGWVGYTLYKRIITM